MAFNEDWYSNEQLDLLVAAYDLARHVPGDVLEVGCWEGRSTVALARACFPKTLVAIDTWEGSFDEAPDHVTVTLARERDVYAIFRENVRELTAGNVFPAKCDWRTFMAERPRAPIAFCHLDAAHDYVSVRDQIRALLPHMSPGGTICGDDFENADAGREDLQGGVERAVRECLPAFSAHGNFWQCRIVE